MPNKQIMAKGYLLLKSATTANEKGIEGVRIVSDTGIYAITDSDGKYHIKSIELPNPIPSRYTLPLNAKTQ